MLLSCPRLIVRLGLFLCPRLIARLGLFSCPRFIVRLGYAYFAPWAQLPGELFIELAAVSSLVFLLFL